MNLDTTTLSENKTKNGSGFQMTLCFKAPRLTSPSSARLQQFSSIRRYDATICVIKFKFLKFVQRTLKMEVPPSQNKKRMAFCDLSNSKQAIMMQKSRIFDSVHKDPKARNVLNNTDYNYRM